MALHLWCPKNVRKLCKLDYHIGKKSLFAVCSHLNHPVYSIHLAKTFEHSMGPQHHQYTTVSNQSVTINLYSHHALDFKFLELEKLFAQCRSYRSRQYYESKVLHSPEVTGFSTFHGFLKIRLF